VLPHHVLEQLLQRAVAARYPDADISNILVRPCPDARFGDYQCSSLIALAKERKSNPREVAVSIAADLARALPNWAQCDIAGAGFINFRIQPAILNDALTSAIRGEHLFFDKSAQPRTIVIDFSSPNVAKPMHVGHIRSTILGDCLSRTLRLLGHRVITDNHIGDWGTQFGKLLVGWKELLDRSALESDPLGEMERLYKDVNKACEKDPGVLDRARSELVRLQQGDAENLQIWKQMQALSQSQFEAIYGRLGVQFDHCLGESFYNARLKPVVQELIDTGLAQESEGAMVVYFEEPELKAHPALVQKSDGAANYTTTDLATLQYRLESWNPDEIVYVTDARQQLHFKQLFTIFRRWHAADTVRLAHVWFGAILGEDGKPIKTRSGETIKLADLLDEAEERAFQVVSEKSPDLDESSRREIARVVGIGAVKYADLLPNRQSDYIFSWDKMLALNGNTAPYLQYAYARIRSIFRKNELSPDSLTALISSAQIDLSAPEEIALAKHMLNFGLVLRAVADEYRPNYLCNYLYELAGHFARFYENCPVLKAAEAQKNTRLILCELTSRVLKQGLDCLGIATLDQM
jgi:arginyl-tRNA synthetase